MPLNMLDANDAYLIAKAKVAEFRKEFEQEWYGPLLKAFQKAAMTTVRDNPIVNKEKLMQNLSPAARERLRNGD